MYNLTSLLIGIDCPSLDFKAEKISILEPKKENLWGFKIVL